MKLTVVGGGSTYTPELIDGIARLRDRLPVTELVLVDPDEDRLPLVGGVSTRIMAAYGHPAKVGWTTDLDDGLDGSGAVLLQLRVGGQAARDRDETWPLECGCKAALRGGRDRVVDALLAHPIIGQYDQATKLADRLIAENRAHLPWVTA
ncbi:MAG: glycoside hydrolase family 4 [Actinomycetia bacterium]|nr:glycoside hydrolase family 4 [Actinomycetes bacterium]